MGYETIGIHNEESAKEAVEQAESIFIGGKNTFVLVDSLYREGVMDAIRERAENGIPYIGTSAGSNVAGLDIGTTNDMPIVHPPSFKTMGLVPFNINPHYQDTDPASKHKNEPRETRINEFRVFNEQPVVGLREGSMLHIHGKEIDLKKVTDARVFIKGENPLNTNQVAL